MRNILLVIDMLNDFVHENGALNFGQARNIIAFIKKRLTQYRLDRYKLRGLDMYNVIFICDSHNKNDKEFERFPAHAIENTWGSEIIKELAPIEHEKVVYKTRFNGFYNTPLEAMLTQLRPNKVEVVGVCTSICIMDTVAGLVERNHKVIVPVKGVADFDDKAHEFSLARMKNLYGAKII